MAVNMKKVAAHYFFLILTFSSSSLSLPDKLSSLPDKLALLSENRRDLGYYPPSCERIECPKYDLIEDGDGFEIRRYNSSVWISTSPIQNISLVDATRTGFLQLFNYIQGKNEYNETIEMTAPVTTLVSPSDGPFCSSSFVVSFYVPEKNQADPPPANNLHVQKVALKYLAVRQFAGFVTDTNVGEEAAALQASLADTTWMSAIKKGRSDDTTSVYTVAQYNSPFEFENRVNEIWMLFDVDDDLESEE